MTLDELKPKRTTTLRKLAEDAGVDGADTLERAELLEALGENQADTATTASEESEDRYDELTAPDLKKELSARGLEFGGREGKESLVAKLRADDAGQEDEEAPPEATPELPPPGVSSATATVPDEVGNVPVGSKAAVMKAALAKQPLVRILVPRESGESKRATTSVNLNGYRLNIPKGVYVDVPQQVAEVIAESNDQTLAALEDNPARIGGNEPELNR